MGHTIPSKLSLPITGPGMYSVCMYITSTFWLKCRDRGWNGSVHFSPINGWSVCSGAAPPTNVLSVAKSVACQSAHNADNGVCAIVCIINLEVVDRVEKFVFFVCYPRSGHSILRRQFDGCSSTYGDCPWIHACSWPIGNTFLTGRRILTRSIHLWTIDIFSLTSCTGRISGMPIIQEFRVLLLNYGKYHTQCTACSSRLLAKIYIHAMN